MSGLAGRSGDGFSSSYKLRSFNLLLRITLVSGESVVRLPGERFDEEECPAV